MRTTIHDSWKLVPVKATMEMARAAKREHGGLSVWKADDIYRAMLASAPTPQAGHALVPTRLTAENGAKYALSGEFKIRIEIENPDYDEEDEDSEPTIWTDVSVPWTTIKEIWAAGMKHFGATEETTHG